MVKKQTKKDFFSNVKDHGLTIVGIGASAGGLKALKEFFSKIPEDSGLAFVVVVHLSPEHKSMLSELLQPFTKMPVQQVTKTMEINANHVYVIPPNANLNTIDTHLRLSDLEEQRSQRAPIDHFFRTLAQVHDGHSIGVILTGTGSDGALGIKEIKGRNGIIIVQDPNDAEFDGMPQSAIASGSVDKILPLDQIPDEVIKLSKTKPKVKIAESVQEMPSTDHQVLQKIFTQIRSVLGRDFSRYKISTIMRRLQRRMQLFQVEELEDYLAILRKDHEEVKALAEDFLITVTNFFRDPEVFEHLEKEVVPRLFDNKGPDDQIRVWSVGCATGEEAYSMTMMLLEIAKDKEAAPSIQVFASDLHERSLTMARNAFYPGDIEVDVSQERLKRFFNKEDGGFRIKKEVRERVIFTPHNLLGDPPFSKLDLIVCRNLLIYLKRDVQKDVFGLFHYSLRKDGVLVLGSSETMDNTELFKTESKELSIYKKINVTPPEPRLPVFPPITRVRFDHSQSENLHQQPVSFGILHQEIVEQFAPPSILVSFENQILHISKNAGRYLSYPGGEPTQNIFKLIREEFKNELRGLLYEAKERKTYVQSVPIPAKVDGEIIKVVISARPSDNEKFEKVLLVVFEKEDNHSTSEEEKQVKESNKDTSIKDLESELEVTQHRLQAIIEEYETTQEEMKASNEELQSANEELRSTLEELETSKEELQSMNEELTTVNQENKHKVDELSQLSSDLQNLMASTDIATLFLSPDLRILRFTPMLGEIFNIRPADQGRPITDLTSKIGYYDLAADCQKVLKKLIPVEKEIKDEAGNWFLTRILPYRSTSDRIEGVVITFVDITSRKETEEALRESEEQFRALIEASAQMVWKTDANGNVVEDSPSWREYTGQTYNEWKGRGWINAIHPEDRKLAEENWYGSVENEQFVNTEFRVKHNDGSWRWTNVRAVPLRNGDGTIRGWMGMNIDIHDKKIAEQSVRQNEDRLKKMVNIDSVGVLLFDESGKIIYTNDAFLKMTKYSHGNIKNLTWRDITHKDFLKITEDHLQGLKQTNHTGSYEKICIDKDGNEVWMLFAGSCLGDGTFIEYCLNIEDRKKAENALKESEEHLRNTRNLLSMANEASKIGWGTWDFKTGIAEWDKRAGEILHLKKPKTTARDWMSIIHPDDRLEVRNQLDESITENKSFDLEYRIILPKEKIRYIHATGAIELDKNGNPLRGTGLIKDITEQKLLQQQKDDFMRIASHELKTPISIVKGYINYIEEIIDEDGGIQDSRLLKKADRQIDKIIHLINDLLDVSKMESGKIEFDHEEIDFDAMVEEVVEEMRNISPMKLEVQGSTGKKVMGDKERISQVVINFISNAIKYSPDGEKVVITMYTKDGNAAVDIKDHGIGIHANELKKVFDRFYRVKKVGHRLKGLGLGLYISSEIIKRQNGKVWVNSEEGKGSVFSFSIPAKN